MDNWQDDIERYINGKMTPAERHALEKRALSDPFLADALEGAESIASSDFAADVNQLNQKIAGAGKNRWLWPMRSAASIVGLALIATAIFVTMKNDGADQLASNSKVTENKPIESKSDTIQRANSETKTEQAIASSKPAEEKSKAEPLLALDIKKEEGKSLAGGSGVRTDFSIDTKGPVGKSKDSISSTPLLAGYINLDTIKTAEAVTLTVIEEKVADDAITSAPTMQPTVTKEDTDLSRARKKSKQSPNTFAPVSDNLVVTGLVRDQQGQALPGVNINVKGSGQGAVSDGEGRYSLSIQDTAATLIYSFIGFVQQEMAVDKLKNYADVQLMEDATQLSEVVVTGYGEKKTSDEPIVRLAEPIGGRKAYDQYLEEKKIYPQQALDNKIEGKVVIEFTVGVTGVISDFNVLKKIGYGCEEEVIRLVKEGPGWSPSYIDNEPVESLVRIKTRFELPGK